MKTGKQAFQRWKRSNSRLYSSQARAIGSDPTLSFSSSCTDAPSPSEKQRLKTTVAQQHPHALENRSDVLPSRPLHPLPATLFLLTVFAWGLGSILQSFVLLFAGTSSFVIGIALLNRRAER